MQLFGGSGGGGEGEVPFAEEGIVRCESPRQLRILDLVLYPDGHTQPEVIRAI